jgi:aryl-alcohol dehydrogenase-like predicted oxidoreductase
MEKRAYGRTGEALSVVGFGGIVVRDTSPDEAADIVAKAIERGVNYFDVAPSYGNAEGRLGPALEPYRDDVFLACKTGKRQADNAEQELHASLERLRTDHVDLYQLHGVSSVEQAEEILAPGGALETLVAARERGLTRYLGFSAHSEDAAVRLLDAFAFDSVLVPINLFCWRGGGFGARVVEKAGQTGAAVLALKSLAKRPLREGEQKTWRKCWYVPVDTPVEARVALSFTLSRPVTAAVSPGHAELLWLACDAAESLAAEPVEPPQEAEAEGEPIFSAPT